MFEDNDPDRKLSPWLAILVAPREIWWHLGRLQKLVRALGTQGHSSLQKDLSRSNSASCRNMQRHQNNSRKIQKKLISDIEMQHAIQICSYKRSLYHFHPFSTPFQIFWRKVRNVSDFELGAPALLGSVSTPRHTELLGLRQKTMESIVNIDSIYSIYFQRKKRKKTEMSEIIANKSFLL